MPRKPDPDNVIAFTRTTAATVQLGEGQKERVVWDRETPGFGLRLRAGGSRMWVIRPAPSSGKYGLFTIGPTTKLNLTQAREAAKDHLAKSQLGENPREARAVAKVKEATTFGAVADRYLTRAETLLTPANLKDLTRYMTRDFLSLRDRPISRITRADVAACIEQLAARAPATANRARSQLSTFFVWAIGQGVVDINPVMGVVKPAKDVRRSRVLNDAELLKVWQACGADDFGAIIRLLMLTGQRRDEVAAMTWDELDLDAGIWTIPDTRTKNDRVHEVPLSAPAVEIMMGRAIRRGNPFVFGRGAGPFSGFTNAKERLDAATKLRLPWVIHDLRRSVSTGMNNLKIPPHVVEAVLNHVSGAKAGVAGTYNWALYRDEKREALGLWGRHLLALGEPGLQVAHANAQAPLAEAQELRPLPSVA